MSDASTIDPLATPLATGDRLIVITQDDHRGVLWVISILCLIYTLLLLGIRSGARRREFGWDDTVAAASTVYIPTELEGISTDDLPGVRKYILCPHFR